MKMPRCFILLGGRGTRLFPLTSFVHKSMIPLLGRPVLEYIVDHLRNQGITDIVLCVSDSGSREQFTHYFGDGSRFGLTIRYSTGVQELKTAGRILQAHNEGLVDEDFIVYYGDILTDLNLKDVYKFHLKKSGVGTVVFSPNLPVAAGIAVLDENSDVQKIAEKPLLPHKTNIGIYVLKPEILKFIEPDSDFFADTFPRVIENKDKIYGYVSDCRWLDIGSFQNLLKAEEFVKNNFRGK